MSLIATHTSWASSSLQRALNMQTRLDGSSMPSKYLSYGMSSLYEPPAVLKANESKCTKFKNDVVKVIDKLSDSPIG